MDDFYKQIKREITEDDVKKPMTTLKMLKNLGIPQAEQLMV